MLLTFTIAGKAIRDATTPTESKTALVLAKTDNNQTVNAETKTMAPITGGGKTREDNNSNVDPSDEAF